MSKQQLNKQTAIIIGGGPAGLTAAYELLQHTDIVPIVFEMTNELGGISKTINYKGNRIDIGGHRFFSKSERVMQWWQHILPVQRIDKKQPSSLALTYQNKQQTIDFDNKGPNPDEEDNVMLVRNRLSRIYFQRKFFDYPISLKWQTLNNLGLLTTFQIGWSYLRSILFPIKKERSLEDFFINRFGKKLYTLFFKDYTQKVWGLSCSEISPEWGAQRVKGLSVWKTIKHALTASKRKGPSIDQKGIETSLIEKFLYPKYGPGQMWERVGELIVEQGGTVYRGKKVVGMQWQKSNITGIEIEDVVTKKKEAVRGNYFFSTMPVKELITSMGNEVPKKVQKVADSLSYRDFITVGLLLKMMKTTNNSSIHHIPDNWLYIQEKEVNLGRIQVFNNWSPYMIKNPKNVWLGLEYFCTEGDELWRKSDDVLKTLAADELVKIGLIEKNDVIDGTVLRMPKTYPVYHGAYEQFDVIRQFTDGLENLFLIGRNGMHRYNNQDHSMLTAMQAVENIKNGITTKENIWAVNIEKNYHEEKNAGK